MNDQNHNPNHLPEALESFLNKEIGPEDKAKIEQHLQKLKQNPKTSPIFNLVTGLTGFPLNKIIESISKNIQESNQSASSKASTTPDKKSSDLFFGSIIDAPDKPPTTSPTAKKPIQLPKEAIEHLPSSIKTTLLSSGKYTTPKEQNPILKNSVDLRGILLILALLGLIGWSVYGYFG